MTVCSTQFSDDSPTTSEMTDPDASPPSLSGLPPYGSSAEPRDDASGRLSRGIRLTAGSPMTTLSANPEAEAVTTTVPATTPPRPRRSSKSSPRPADLDIAVSGNLEGPRLDLSLLRARHLVLLVIERRVLAERHACPTSGDKRSRAQDGERDLHGLSHAKHLPLLPSGIVSRCAGRSGVAENSDRPRCRDAPRRSGDPMRKTPSASRSRSSSAAPSKE